MFANKLFLFLLFFIFSSVLVTAQKKTRYSLEKERKEIQKKMADAAKLLAETKNEKKSSESELRALNQRIFTQESYLKNLQSEVQLINNEMSEMEDIIYALQRDLDSLKKEYSEMVYITYKANNAFSKLSFLFTSQSYNQLMMRIKYLDQFRRARKAQVEKIQQMKDYLVEKEVDLQEKLNEKKETLKKLENEKNQLASLQQKQQSLLSQLSSREKEFLSKIKQYEKEQEKLNKLIKDIIEEEIAKERARAAAEAKKNATTSSSNSKLESTKETTIISNNFSANKGRLPWPLTRCFISRKFGKQPHPVLASVYTMNNGLGLQCEKSSEVKAVFDGTVTTVATIPGMNKIVMVKHGDYFSVYAKLEAVYVSTGDKITAKSPIGRVYTNGNNETELEFQIWNGKEKLDPQLWLAR